ncbi:NAD-dependent epimerase/dehydratase family protein [Nocardioides sp. KIGAM211]|uniref:NAD-dependent epimerase/dehydratase family protein n=1 Tax=Nocardioides luti TaxID=2761101 RepID=A0A7X0VBC1_9ACTN|nr:NAD-dependent epimerase/dehydratase family protein [Nocardioides luti]
MYALLQDGVDVRGVDAFTDYYAHSSKLKNLELSGLAADRFRRSLVSELTASDLEGVDVVFHLAAQPGVRDSWGHFGTYLRHNLEETNALAIAARAAGVKRIVFASSSSVYGDAASYPTSEASQTMPRSPYGVTKLAAESLLRAHANISDYELILMRFFTVYGPGQRPDMAIQRLIECALDTSDREFHLFGDGHQRRDFTYVGDLVRALRASAVVPMPERISTVNVGGAGDISMLELIDMVEVATQSKIRLVHEPVQVGDVVRTGADPARARDLLGWSTAVQATEGVQRQVDYVRRGGMAEWSG